MQTLTPEAQRDLDWLIRRLGKERVQGPVPADEPPGTTDWMLTLTRSDGRKVGCYGESPAEALSRAREWLEGGAGFTSED